MGALYTAEEIMEIIEARLAVGMMHDDVGEICTDTRVLQEGQWFLALRGHEFDGHDFLGEAFSSGAIGCIVEERANYPIASTSFPLLAVPDTADALCTLARNWRKRINPRVALLPADESLEALGTVLNEEFASHFKDRFLFIKKASCLDVFQQVLDMPDDTRAMLIQYQLNLVDEAESLGRAVLPNVVVLTEESVRAFRLQLTDTGMAALPFALMPTLKLSHGLLIVDSAFQDQLFVNVDEAFLRNVLLFGSSLTEADFADGRPVEFLRAAGPDDKIASMLERAKAHAKASGVSEDYVDLTELAAIVMMMVGVDYQPPSE